MDFHKCSLTRRWQGDNVTRRQEKNNQHTSKNLMASDFELTDDNFISLVS